MHKKKSMFEKRRRNKPSISYKVDSIKKDQKLYK
jgi:hypothetical protein